MKKYLLFLFDYYYPSGGWNDFKGSFDTIEEAKSKYDGSSYSECQVIDRDTGEEIF